MVHSVTRCEVSDTSKHILANCVERFCHQQAESFLTGVSFRSLSSPPDLSIDDWVASVCLQTETATVDLQVFFNEAASQAILAKVMSAYPAPSREYTGQEVMQECLNVVIGRVKGIIATELKIVRGKKMFLPQLRKVGIADLNRKQTKDGTHSIWWDMNWTGHRLSVSCDVSLFQELTAEVVDVLKSAQLVEENSDENVKFL